MFHSMHSSIVSQKQFSLPLKKQYIFTQLPLGYFNSSVGAHTFSGKILTTSNSFQEHRSDIILITSSCKEIQTIYTLTRNLQTLVTELSNQGWAIASCEIYFSKISGHYSTAQGWFIPDAVRNQHFPFISTFYFKIDSKFNVYLGFRGNKFLIYKF